MPRAVIMLTSTRQRLALAVALVAIATLVVWYANQIAPHISDLASGWSQAYLFPLLNPVGADFRAGVYFPGSLLVSGKDPYVGSGLWYPPFSALFLLPYQIFDVAQAYSIHVVVVVLLTIASVWMSIRIAGLAVSNGASSAEAGERGTSIPLFLSLTFLTLSSYGFLFGVERGNMDVLSPGLLPGRIVGACPIPEAALAAGDPLLGRRPPEGLPSGAVSTPGLEARVEESAADRRGQRGSPVLPGSGTCPPFR